MGRLIHFEIHADDPDRAVAFYTGVFGWTVSRWGEEPYWLLSTGPEDEPGINGAICPRTGPRPEGGTPVLGTVNTVQVDDLDASLAKAIELGATPGLDKRPIPGVGTVAYVIDPEGNMVGMLQPEPAA